MNLIETLNANADKTPDEIVRALDPHVVFCRQTFRPWEVPPQYAGRQVLIEWSSDLDDPDPSWWRSPGEGSAMSREEAEPWHIETAFSRFTSQYNEGYLVRLHLI